MNEKKYDNATLIIIKKLLAKDKVNELSKIDKIYLEKLLNKEINYEFIKNEIKVCKNDLKYFINKYIYVKNKFNIENIPEALRGKVLDDRVKFELQPVQEKLVDAILTKNRIVSVKSRQIGFTTTTIACCLQLATYNNNKNILIFSKSEKDAIKTLDELKFMYENLPFFLRRAVLENNKKTLKLGDKYSATTIESYSSGKNSGRSASATQLVLDEAEFIQNIEDLQSAAAMTLSATGGKAIILSTPQMYDSQFYRLVKGAEEGKNDFVLIKGDQREVPGRDEKQYQEQCALLNWDKKKIKTELNMEQIIPYETYFHEKVLEELKDKTIVDYYNSIEIYEEPDKNAKYLISLDTQEGGDDNNVIIVINIYTKEIAAFLYTKKDIIQDLIYLSKKYNNAKIALERNRAFSVLKSLDELGEIDRVLYEIKYDREKDSLIVNKEKRGIYTSSVNREKYLQLVSDYIKKHKELPKKLVEELKTFVIKKNGKPEGLKHDDAIMALGINLIYLEAFSKTNDEETKTVFQDYIRALNKNLKDIKVNSDTKQEQNIEDKLMSFYNVLAANDIDDIATLKIKAMLAQQQNKDKEKKSKYLYFL